MSNNLSRREFMNVVGTAGLAAALAPAGARAARKKPPHVVFVTGDDEYRSEVTMPFIAQLLGRKNQFKCTVLYAVDPATGEPNPKYQKNIVGLDALKTADVAVFYMRFRSLPDEQLKLILDYVNSGKPIVGLRTSTHAFRYPAGHKNQEYNDRFGIDVFGQKWITHHGHRSTTEVSIIPAMREHPILRGIYGSFPCSSWLYHVEPLAGDCQPLLTGKAMNSNKTDKQDKFPLIQPVAWTKTYKGARVFFMTLGHPKDFEEYSVRRLLMNGIYWASGLGVPEGGALAEPKGDLAGWQAPETH
ncbi:MAG: ThuA domain-containing protein [Planctomycetota bacterium]|jgi:type 1 glutamine amidotransferase